MIKSLRIGFAIVLACLAMPVTSATYPSKAIKLVIPFTPGGGSDIVGRLVAEKLSARLGQPIVIINVPGAGGIIATQQVAAAAADGYTLFYANASTLTISPQLLRRKTPPPWISFTAVAPVAEFFNVIIVNSDVPATTLKELILYGKANPDKLSFGSPGVGTTPHLLGEIMRRETGIKMTHVPYKGSAPAINDLLGGHISLLFEQPATIAPYLANGRVRALAVAADKRAPSLPNVPTVAEAGLQTLSLNSWAGIVAPVGTPTEIVERLNNEVAFVLALPEIREALMARGYAPMKSTPQQFDKLVRDDYARWASLIKDLGIQTD